MSSKVLQIKDKYTKFNELQKEINNNKLFGSGKDHKFELEVAFDHTTLTIETTRKDLNIKTSLGIEDTLSLKKFLSDCFDEPKEKVIKSTKNKNK